MKRQSNTKTKIIITGSTGFLGKHFVKHLSKRYKVLAHNLRDKPPKEHIPVIIHLATRMIKGDIEDMKLLYDNINVAEKLVNLAKAVNPKQIINLSSANVHSHKTKELRPSDNRECLYGLSKFCGENILDFLLRTKHTNIVHLRVVQVYGYGMREDRIIPTMLKELKEKNQITLYGHRVESFIDISSLLKVVSSFIDKRISGIFPIEGERLTYLQLAKKIIAQAGDGKSRIRRRLIKGMKIV